MAYLCDTLLRSTAKYNIKYKVILQRHSLFFYVIQVLEQLFYRMEEYQDLHIRVSQYKKLLLNYENNIIMKIFLKKSWTLQFVVVKNCKIVILIYIAKILIGCILTVHLLNLFNKLECVVCGGLRPPFAKYILIS